MSGFYQEMADMVSDLLDPNELGQGAITVARITPGTPDPAEPWIPVEPTRVEETVNQIGEAKAEYVQAGTIITTDLAYMVAPMTTLAPRPGDVVEIGETVIGTVVHAAPFPPHGTTVFTTVYVNR